MLVRTSLSQNRYMYYEAPVHNYGTEQSFSPQEARKKPSSKLDELAEQGRKELEELDATYKLELGKVESATALQIKSLIVMADKDGRTVDLATAEDLARTFLVKYKGDQKYLQDKITYLLATILNRRGRYVASLEVLQELDTYLTERLKELTEDNQEKRWLEQRQIENVTHLIESTEILIVVTPEGAARQKYEALLETYKQR